jgi:hypothetical protein
MAVCRVIEAEEPAKKKRADLENGHRWIAWPALQVLMKQTRMDNKEAS